MQPEELIPAETFCTCHRIELSFIRELHDSGLIGMTIREGAVYLPSSALLDLERFVLLRYEMDVNLEGIEVISHLLEKLNSVQQELTSQQNKLRFYQAQLEAPDQDPAPED